MANRAISDHGAATVTVLFPPHLVPVVDVFRALGDFEDHYDVAALDDLERRLSATMSRDLAKGLVSDALLLAFGLRRDRARPLAFKSILSRRGTLDEYRLIGLIGATFWNDFALATEAAAALGARHPQPLISLAFDLARRLEAAGARLDRPDPRLLEPQQSTSPLEVLLQRANSPDFRRTFDF
jgi:hypothetical protein